MALAVIRSLGNESGAARFEADIGTNRFYRYSIGSEKDKSDGFEYVDSVSFQSPLVEKKSARFSRGFEIAVPLSRFDRENRFIQLSSYKNVNGKSPAWSRVIQVHPVLPFERNLTIESKAMQNTIHTAEPHFKPCRTVENDLVENRLSGAMFWDQLIDFAKLVAPAAATIADGLLRKDDKGKVKNDSMDQVLQFLLQAATKLAKQDKDKTKPNPADATTQNKANKPVATNGNGAVTKPQQAVTQSFNTVGPNSVPYRNIRAKRRRYRRRMSRAQDFGIFSGPALAGLVSSVAPSVLKGIGPVLQKSPEMLKTLADTPIKLLTAINEAKRKEQELLNAKVKDMLAQGNQALLYNLLLNRPQTNGAVPTIPAALLSGSASVKSQTKKPAAKVEKRIQAKFISPSPIDVWGRPRTVYKKGAAIALEMSLDAVQQAPTRPIPKVIAHLRIKNSATGKLLYEHTHQLTEVYLNEKVRLDIPLATMALLPASTDLLASLDVRWRSKDGTVFTTEERATQAFVVCEDVLLKSVGDRVNQELRLSDPNRYRAFWHRLWEGGSAKHSRWELKATARYYYRLAKGQDSNGRLDTKFRAMENRSRETESRIEWGGMLKGGMELAINELNKLLPQINSEEKWSTLELSALESEAFCERVNQQATVDLEIRGRTEERGTIWAFPIMDLVEVELARVVATGSNGEVTETVSVNKQFPVPVSAVFIGMENES